MRKIVLLLLAVALFLSIGIQNASAENSLRQGALGLGIDTNSDMFISAKYLLAKDLALTGGLGFVINGGDADGTDVAVGVGVRKYLKVADFAPFIGGFFKFSDEDRNASDTEEFALLAEGGAEYFIARQFSFEGAVRFGYKSTDVRHGARYTSFGTERASIGFNFYF